MKAETLPENICLENNARLNLTVEAVATAVTYVIVAGTVTAVTVVTVVAAATEATAAIAKLILAISEDLSRMNGYVFGIFIMHSIVLKNKEENGTFTTY